MGQDRVGVGADETGCMPVILLQGRQEGQMGFLVSVLAPSGKEDLGDGRAVNRQGPLPPSLLPHTHSIHLLPEEICLVPLSQQSPLWGWDTGRQYEPCRGMRTGFAVRQTGCQSHPTPSGVQDLVHPFSLLILSFLFCKMRINL